MTGAHDGTPQALGTATTSGGGLGDRGAVAVEFAILFPVLMLMFWGIFGLGVVMTQEMQLTFVVENAATLQAAGGNGMAYATTQLKPPVSFTSANRHRAAWGCLPRRSTEHGRLLWAFLIG